MKMKKVLILLLTCVLTCSVGTPVLATTQDEIAAAQAQKQEAQAGLAQAQANISSLESKKQELESYLAELDAQYNELTNTISQLSVEAAEKEEELKTIQTELEKAKKKAEEQYEAMKLRIVYMYEKGGSSMLEMLLSSQNIADFLNQAENISKISEYDRDMLKQYEATQNNIKEQEEKAEEEAASINELLSEKSAKQQEVQTMVANTNSSISSYVSQISASQEEASVLMEQVNSAESSISSLMQQAAAEQAAAEAAAQEAAAAQEEAQTEESTAEETVSEETEALPEFDPETDTTASESSSTSSDIIVEEEASEDAGEEYTEPEVSEDDYTEDAGTEETAESSSSGQGTYLGNFMLTAYCNCAQCCGTAGNATASGVMPTAGHTVAMSGVPFGTQLLINGTVYTVEDLGTPYGHVDIYCGSHEEAMSFGLQYADVYQLN